MYKRIIFGIIAVVMLYIPARSVAQSVLSPGTPVENDDTLP